MRKGDENGSKHTVYCLFLKNFKEGGGGGGLIDDQISSKFAF